MAPITKLFLCLVVVSTMDFERAEATAIPTLNQLPVKQMQKGLELLQGELSKAKEVDENEENSIDKDGIKSALPNTLDGINTKATDLQGLLSSGAKAAAAEAAAAASQAAAAEETVAEAAAAAAAEAVEAAGVAETAAAAAAAAQVAAAGAVAKGAAVAEAAVATAADAADAAEAAEAAAAEAVEAAAPGRQWPWYRLMNAVRYAGSEAFACATSPIHLLKKFFPSLDEEALGNVSSFFKLFSVRSLFTGKVLYVLQSAVKGDFRPIIEGISNTLFAFKMKRISADGGYIGHKLTIKNPVKEVYIKYFINPSTIKLGVAMNGIKPQVIDLKKLIGSSMNYICTPIPGIIGAYACLRVEMEHPLHGVGNQVCMSGFMRYVFGDGPSMYFGCLKMNIPSIKKIASAINSGTDEPLAIEGKQMEDDDEQIQGLDLNDNDEDEGAEEQIQDQEQTKSVFVGATDYLVNGIGDLLDRVDLSDEDKNMLNRAKEALANLMAFKDINGRISVTPSFVTSLFMASPVKKQPEETIIENEKDGSESGSQSTEKSGEAKEIEGEEVNKEEPPKEKELFFY